MNEIVIISGKGGTGKTSLTASFVALAAPSVIVDCDVDAADLHLLLTPDVQQRHRFTSGHQAVIRQQDCSRCGLCHEYCRFGAITVREQQKQAPVFIVDPLSCEGCGVCVQFCPVKAIDFPEQDCGEWMVSQTRYGPMVHARLGIAAENSGKLVATVRRQARQIAEVDGHSLIIVDGPPGIGCPVIASVTGASIVLAVTEPTVSGIHDLERVLQLTRHFGISTSVCINKWDLNPEMTERIEQNATQANAQVVGRIRYDRNVTLAQMHAQAVVETETPAADDIRSVWRRLQKEIQEKDNHENSHSSG